jgi:hypothetical protein
MYVGVLASVTKLSDKSESFLVSSCSLNYTDDFAKLEPGINSGALYLEFVLDKVA